ncbi:D-threo-aldose 1-dehydrogenase [Cyclobacterium lianum]|uniref:D-threo-aldose 1-dehydrogenase n=1 Tax=Cyclobacterium lianum TaxID=388280 RepID=A0A1M7QP88_9BACT|nr:aldo/keto reductase [Cyclobacterium lianum]SHN33329.1 D-threo-aldose 1-dehydrogenase [Cyclobacterium lianum]
MNSRRKFINKSLQASLAISLSPQLQGFGEIVSEDMKRQMDLKNVKLPANYGLGGVAIGNGFRPTTDEQAQLAMEGAWEAGVRFFDTSPWYGLGLSERRFGRFLHNQRREDYVLATKVGRLLKPAKKAPGNNSWKNASPFDYEYDYSASGVRRSIEDSLQRLGINSIDIVFIHDLSPDNGDMKDNWKDYFEVAAKGAMPELTKMKEEGLIKGWGLGVNRIDPILETLKVADPDVCLSATQYSLMYHEDALDRLFPACEEKGVDIVVGAPLNAGFLAGIDRYNYWGEMPEGFKEKRRQMKEIAGHHGIDLIAAALQFSAAPDVVSAVIPGTRYPDQAKANVEAMKVKIPEGFWEELVEKKLISEKAPWPG